jgi:hypothetical protein
VVEEDFHSFVHDVCQSATPPSGQALAKRLGYQRLVRLCRETVLNCVPAGAIVLSITKGDEKLVNLDGRQGWHFPQDDYGVYAGCHPADSVAAIAHLEMLRSKGAGYFVIPATAFWWLAHYAALKAHLERNYRLLYRSEHTCLIFSLSESSAWRETMEFITQFKTRHRRCPAILNWESGVDLAATFPECAVFSPMEPESNELLYLDESIDIVAVASEAGGRVSESRRVASGAVLLITVPASAQGHVEVVVDRLPNGVACRLDESASRRLSVSHGNTARVDTRQ